MWTRAFLFLAASALSACAQDGAGPKVDAILQSWNKVSTPGASVAVVQDGRIVYQKGVGAANLEYDVPIRPDTVFHVASVSKQFTAMAIVLLELDGKLSIDEDVHKYLPELPDYGSRLTIRQLLQHTSGVRDQWQTLGLAGWRLDDVITQRQILRMLFRQKELNFTPGTRHLYSNGGYSLLAEIVNRVSGKSLPDFCDERIFKPLQMTRTHYHDDHRRIVRDRAVSYETWSDGFRISPLNYANVGATSLFTTAPDLARWLDNFRDPKVGGAKAIARLQEEAKLTNGDVVPYGLGVSTAKYRGLRTISHSGGDAGYRSHVVWFPDQRLGVAVVSNLASFNPGGIANQIAAVYLGDALKAEPPKPQPASRTFVTLEKGIVERYAGKYRLGDMSVEVAVRDGKLMAAPVGSTLLELKPLAPNRFYAEQRQAEIEFTPTNAGGMTMRLIEPGVTVTGERFVILPFDPADLKRYPGTYWSDELETQYTVVLKNDVLTLDHAHHGELSLVPTSKDQFRGGAWFLPEVKFLRDASGNVNAMLLGGNRLTGIRFARR